MKTYQYLRRDFLLAESNPGTSTSNQDKVTKTKFTTVPRERQNQTTHTNEHISVIRCQLVQGVSPDGGETMWALQGSQPTSWEPAQGGGPRGNPETSPCPTPSSGDRESPEKQRWLKFTKAEYQKGQIKRQRGQVVKFSTEYWSTYICEKLPETERKKHPKGV